MINIIVIIAIIAIATLMIYYRELYIVKVTWKYALILLPFILLCVFKAFGKKKSSDSTSTTPVAIDSIRDQLREANMTASIEVACAREDNKIKLEELKKATEIKDGAERRKRLAELMD